MSVAAQVENAWLFLGAIEIIVLHVPINDGLVRFSASDEAKILAAPPDHVNRNERKGFLGKSRLEMCMNSALVVAGATEIIIKHATDFTARLDANKNFSAGGI